MPVSKVKSNSGLCKQRDRYKGNSRQLRASTLSSFTQSTAPSAPPAAVGRGEPAESGPGEVHDGAAGADIRRARVAGRKEEPRARRLPPEERDGQEEGGGGGGRTLMGIVKITASACT